MKTKTILIIGGVVVGGGVAWYLYNRNKNQVVQTNEDFSQTEQAIVAIENKILDESKSAAQEQLYKARYDELYNACGKKNKMLLATGGCKFAAETAARKEFPKLSGLGSPLMD